MRLGIMQPYFLPYLGYFALIKATDKWIVFDTPQFENRSWINRNRILDANKRSWMYITVPITKHALKTPIYKIKIQNAINWKDKIIGQMGYYRKYAPYYNEVADFLFDILKMEFDKLSDLNIATMKATCSYLNINLNYEVFSEMDLNLEPVKESDEWGLNICKSMGVTNFINPEGGQNFVNRDKYLHNNITLKFFKFGYTSYNQHRNEFITRLSVIDAMMFNSPDEINKMLDVYQLV